MSAYITPSCICEAHDWESTGNRLAAIAQRFFVCRQCKRTAWSLIACGQEYFIIADEVDFDVCAVNRYLTDVLLPMCRERCLLVNAARVAIEEQAWCDFLNREGLPADTTIGDIDGRHPKCVEVELFVCLLSLQPEYRVPIGFEDCPIPPKLPRTLTAYRMVSLRHDRRWELVDHDESEKLHLP